MDYVFPFLHLLAFNTLESVIKLKNIVGLYCIFKFNYSATLFFQEFTL